MPRKFYRNLLRRFYKFAMTRRIYLKIYELWSPATSKSSRAFQLGSWTWDDRYPELFTFVANFLGPGTRSVLSFGCSTGEEVFTLRKYFPRATIKGIDVNILNIAKCNYKLAQAPDENISFERASDCSDQPKDHYDAIFCMAVLRNLGLDRNPPQSSVGIFIFEEFERSINSIYNCLKPGGVLVIAMTNFRVLDTAIAQKMAVIWKGKFHEPFVSTAVYNANNQLVDPHFYSDIVFQKAG